MHRIIVAVDLLMSLLAAILLLGASCRERVASGAELPYPGTEARMSGNAPELPRVRVDFPASVASSPARVLEAGDNLQDALDKAKPGEVIALKPGTIFKGPLTLPNKSGEGWITIRTAAADAVFPAPGVRVDPSNAPLMPIIESSSDPVIATDAGAHHYRFIGIEIRPRTGAFLHNLIALGMEEGSAEELPHHIVFERCYLHGDPQVGGRRGIALNGRNAAVVDSYLSDFKEQGADSQAIAGWNGLGPFTIVNNYIEGAGENIMFGGADPTVKNLVPADIEIRMNHLAKPLSWKIGDPSYAGTPWTIKNLLELKNARRVLIEGNILEYNWVQAQNGFAILFTPRNQDGSAPWSMVQDVTFTSNILRHTGSAVNIAGRDDNHPSQQTSHILIRNNLFEDVDGAKWGGSGRLVQLLSGAADVVIDHNTAFHTGEVIAAAGIPTTGLVYQNNLTPHNQYGVAGDSAYGNPILTLTKYFPGAVFEKNVLEGGNASSYPPDNFFPPTMADVRFVDLPGGNYRLQPASSYKRAGTDGKDIGADIDALTSATTVRTPTARYRAVAHGGTR